MITSNDDRVKRLIDAGVLSPRCRRFTLSLEAGSVAMLTQEFYVTGEEFDALAELIPEAEQHAVAVFRGGQEQDLTLDITPLGSDWREKIVKP